MIARLLGLALASALLVCWSGAAQDPKGKGKDKDAKVKDGKDKEKGKAPAPGKGVQKGESAKDAGPRPVVQATHIGAVHAVTFGPSGRLAATASADNTAKLWHVPTGRVLHTVVGHHDDVTAVAFSPNGHHLATGSAGRESTVRITEVDSGRFVRGWPETGKVFAMAYSPDGDFLAVAGEDNFVRVRDPRTGDVKQKLTGHQGPIRCLAFDPARKHLIATGAGDKDHPRDHSVRLWNAANGKEQHKLAGHPGGVIAVAFSADGKTLATAGADGTAKLWDVETGKLLFTLPVIGKGKHTRVVGVGFVTRRTLLTVAEDKAARFWDATTGKPLGDPHKFTNEPHLAAVSHDGAHLIVGYRHAVRVLKIDPTGYTVDRARGVSETAQAHRYFDGLHDRGYAMAVSPDGRALAASGRHTITLWRPEANRPVVTLHGLEGPTYALAFSPKGRFLASVSTDDDKKSSVRIWDVATGRQLAHARGQAAETLSVAWSPDGRRIAAASKDRTVGLWHLTPEGAIQGAKLKLEQVTPPQQCYSVAFSPDGKWLAAGQSERVVIWDTATGKVHHKHESKGLSWYALAFSPDSKLLAGGHDLGRIRVWDVTSGKDGGRVFNAYKEEKDSPLSRAVGGLAFSPDGKLLVSTSDDHLVRVWDVAAGTLSQTLRGHGHSVRSVGFTPDGHALVTSSGNMILQGTGDGLTKVWARNPADGAKVPFHPRAVCTLVSFWDENEKDRARAGSWVVYDGHGRYDASNGGDVWWLHWVLNGEPVELWQLKERYYDPHLLAKHLGLNPEPVRKVSDAFAPKPAPRVEVKADPKAKSATVTVTDRGGGVGAVRVLVNGKEVNHKVGADGKITADLKDAPLKGKGDKVRVVAWNADGDLSGRGVEIDLDAEPAPPEHKPELYAIVVGVSEYKDARLNLRFAAKDAEDVAAALRLGGERRFGDKKVHLTLLSSGASGPDGKPTKANIAAAFADAQKAHPQDVFVVFLAGHGVAVPGTDLYCYLSADATDLDPKKYADARARAAQAVSSDELVEWIKRVKALKQVMVLDTCAAGQAANQVTAQRRDVPSAQVRAAETLKDRTGFHVLMGCSADRVSYEANKFQQGLLTYALLDGMKGPAIRKGNEVDVTDLFRHAWEEVPKLAEQIGGVQQPVISSPHAAPFPIGELTKADRESIKLPQPRPELVRPRVADAVGADPLGLEGTVRAVLRDPAAARAAACAYVDADDKAHAYRPAVVYAVTDGTVAVTINLLRDGKVVQTLPPIAGPAGSPEKLAGQVADALRKWKPEQ